MFQDASICDMVMIAYWGRATFMQRCQLESNIGGATVEVGGTVSPPTLQSWRGQRGQKISSFKQSKLYYRA